LGKKDTVKMQKNATAKIFRPNFSVLPPPPNNSETYETKPT
jgi:hypothetical protein